MQSEKTRKLREEYAASGNPPCEHPRALVKEYYLGSDTGDVACTICGETWWRNDPDRPDRRRKS